MTRFFGVVGYAESTQVKLGVWQDVITERPYYGDVVKNNRRLAANAELNDDITVGNSISILADPYALKHFFAMRYVEWSGALWKIVDIDEQRPRLVLRLGGVYNGPRVVPSGTATPPSGGNAGK